MDAAEAEAVQNGQAIQDSDKEGDSSKSSWAEEFLTEEENEQRRVKTKVLPLNLTVTSCGPSRKHSGLYQRMKEFSEICTEKELLERLKFERALSSN